MTHPIHNQYMIIDPPTMCPVEVHKPVRMNSHDFQSLMNCILIGKTPGAVICLIQVDSKGFSCPDILNFKNHFCSNLPEFDYGEFLSIGLVIFWYNWSGNVIGVLKFQKKNYSFSLTFLKYDTFNGNLTFLAIFWT